MADRKTVISHLQIIHTWAEFARERDLQFFTAKHLEDIAQWTKDTLELMKEQEPIKPVISRSGQYFCGGCRGYLCSTGKESGVRHCNYCGRSVKWE